MITERELRIFVRETKKAKERLKISRGLEDDDLEYSFSKGWSVKPAKS